MPYYHITGRLNRTVASSLPPRSGMTARRKTFQGKLWTIARQRKERQMRSLFIGILVVAAVSVSAQSSKTAIPRLADGHPDLQGTWDFAQLTPFERPGDYAGKESV